MRPRLRKLFYHQPHFDSMPETPHMGYFLESWGVHSPEWEHSVSVERTRGKIANSSEPAYRGTHANTRIRVESYPLGIKWEFNLHPRHFEFEFGYAWLEPYGDEGKRRHVSSGPPYVPEPTSVFRDVHRHREQAHLAKYEHERVDPPKDVGPYYGPLGDADGIESHVPGIYLKAWQPLNARAHYLVLDVMAESTDEVLRQYRLRLMYEPRFGLDEGDAFAFDTLTRDVEEKMLKEVWSHAEPPCPVCHEPLWTPHNHDGVTIWQSRSSTAPLDEVQT